MTIPNGYGQATAILGGINLPHGGAMTMGFQRVNTDAANICAGDWFALFTPLVQNCCSQDVNLTEVKIKFGPDETGEIASFTGGPIPGQVGAASLSPGTACLVEKITALGGRRGRGRTYVPGVYEGWANDAGVLDAGAISALSSSFDTMGLQAGIGGWPIFLLHGPKTMWVLNSNGQPRRVPTAGVEPPPTAVTDFVPDPTISTQRRRLR